MKEAIANLVLVAQGNYQRELRFENVDSLALNRLFLGNPGTGKTTVAGIYGQVLKALRMLSNGEVVKKTASDFVGTYVGESQSKTRAIIELAQGKVLLIDEAYNLNDGLYGKQALDTLVEKVMGAPGEDIAVILVGYKGDMLKMLRDQNPGLSRRFNMATAIEFEDFSDTELLAILSAQARQLDLMVPIAVKRRAVRVLAKQRNLANFGNAGAVANLLSDARQRMVARGEMDRRLTEADIEACSELDAEKALEELQGFHELQAEMLDLGKGIRTRRREGRTLDGLIGHFVFLGPPGVGKTTVARAVGRILYSYGILATSTVVETTGLGLVAQFVGQTAPKVEEKMKEAQGGVLFIDEAYELGTGGFGSEAVGQLISMLTLPQFMNGKTVVVLAGYDNEMHEMLEQNPGLKSRFNKFVHFENWPPRRCVDVLTQEALKLIPTAFSLEMGVAARLESGFADLITRPGWANGRDVKELLRKLIILRDKRVSDAALAALPIISLADADQALDEFKRSRPTLPGIDSQSKKSQPQLPTQQQYQQARPPLRQRESQGQQLPPAHVHGHNTEGQEPPLIGDETGDAAHEREAQQHALWESETDRLAAEADQLRLREAEALERKAREERERLEKAMREEEERLRKAAEAAERQRIEEELRRMEEELQRRRAAEEEARRRLEAERARQEKEERLREALRRLGKCPMGYVWNKTSSGYTCAALGHSVSDEQIKAYMY